MRIISGLFKGKKIFEPNDVKTRPLKDLTKESIFNILTHSKKFEINLNKAIVLDLFSGVGGLSIGFSKSGFDIVYANEFDTEIAESFQYNHQNTLVDKRDINGIDIRKTF